MKQVQVWVADDATAGGTLQGLRDCMVDFRNLVPGYYPNALKTWLIVKSAYLSDAQQILMVIAKGSPCVVLSEENVTAINKQKNVIPIARY